MHLKTHMKKLASSLMAAAMVVSSLAVSASAAELTPDTTYEVDATLSCYVNAMGGVEFSDGYGLLTGSTVTVDEDGDATLTLKLAQTSGLSIYTVACTAFIGNDAAPGYYADGAVTTEGVTYTVASTKAVGPNNAEVSWIDSITMPIDPSVSEYDMWLYLNSNVMGCQLGNGIGSGSSNQPGVATPHTAKLTIDWDSLTAYGSAPQTGSSTVKMTVEGGYEVSIPQTIEVNAETKTGTYSVTLTKWAGMTGYVTVTADATGTISNGTEQLSFTNVLAAGQLDAVNESQSGTVTVTSTPKGSGDYTGTLNFVIKHIAAAE